MLKELTERLVAAVAADDSKNISKLAKQVYFEIQDLNEDDVFDEEVFALLNHEKIRGLVFLSFITILMAAK